MLPFVRGLAQVRHHSLEIRIFCLLTFQFAEQWLSVVRQTLPQQFSVHYVFTGLQSHYSTNQKYSNRRLSLAILRQIWRLLLANFELNINIKY